MYDKNHRSYGFEGWNEYGQGRISQNKTVMVNHKYSEYHNIIHLINFDVYQWSNNRKKAKSIAFTKRKCSLRDSIWLNYLSLNFFT